MKCKIVDVTARLVLLSIGTMSGILSVSTDAFAQDSDPLVVFINKSSRSVSVNVDGAHICTMVPGEQCTTLLGGGEHDDHPVSAQTGDLSWNDSVRRSECSLTGATKTYTFLDSEIPFSCEGGEELDEDMIEFLNEEL